MYFRIREIRRPRTHQPVGISRAPHRREAADARRTVRFPNVVSYRFKCSAGGCRERPLSFGETHMKLQQQLVSELLFANIYVGMLSAASKTTRPTRHLAANLCITARLWLRNKCARLGSAVRGRRHSRRSTRSCSDFRTAPNDGSSKSGMEKNTLARGTSGRFRSKRGTSSACRTLRASTLRRGRGACRSRAGHRFDVVT